jgi:hypothetical protein
VIDHANLDTGQRARADRLAVIADELRRRMRPVCASMPDDLFYEMIDGMAAIQLKYELIRDNPDLASEHLGGG